MTNLNANQTSRSVYRSAWTHTGPGLLIALMFVIIATATMPRDQSVANASQRNRISDASIEQQFSDLLAGPGDTVCITMNLDLPLAQLRDADGQMTSNGKTLFMWLARRAKLRSLKIMLTAESTRDAEFAAVVAGHMLSDVSLSSEHLRIGIEERPADRNRLRESTLGVTITMCPAIDGDVK